MVEIGGKPLLWHIMKTYSHHGVKDFVICLGYKGYVIKEFFFNYYRHMSNMAIDLKTGDHQILDSQAEDWRITLVDTGPETMTGGRLKRVAPYLGNQTFCLTYGDGLSDINITAELAFHRKHGKLATVAAVQPPGRFGVLNINAQDQVISFEEKPSDEIGWINGGFLSWSQGLFRILRVTRLPGSEHHYPIWRRTVNWLPFIIAVTGSLAIRCETSVSWRRCGLLARLRGVLMYDRRFASRSGQVV